MINYNISKINNNIILTLPTNTNYYNEYNKRTYNNKAAGITLKKQPISKAHLESIKIENNDITTATQDDIIFQFRTTTGNIININAGENNAKLQKNIEDNINATDFYIQAVDQQTNRLYLIDFINTVLLEIYSNRTVLDELCGDEVVANPCPDCPDAQPWINELNAQFEELIVEDWISDVRLSTNFEENNYICAVEITFENSAALTLTTKYNNETKTKTRDNYAYISDTVTVIDGINEIEITVTAGENTKTFTLLVPKYTTTYEYDLSSTRDTE